MTIKRGGHTFAGVDKPIRTPNHKSGKSHAVVIKQGDGFRLIRFGMQGAKTKPPRKGESEADKAKRRSFKARHAKNIAKGKTSAAYWADKVMAEEPIKPNPPVDTAALIAEVEALRKSKAELLDDYKKAKEAAKAVPQDVDVNALIAFKQKKEQEELEAKGRYEEATEKLAAQYRQAEEAKNQRIQELEKRQRELEVEAPAVTALADVVHDPQYVLSRLNKDQLSRDPDGTVVVVDGYNRTSVKEWAQQNMPQWVQKNPRPQGGGATTTKVTADVVTGESNPFARESFNLTEQARLYRTDINKYNMLKNAVSG